MIVGGLVADQGSQVHEPEPGSFLPRPLHMYHAHYFPLVLLGLALDWDVCEFRQHLNRSLSHQA